MKTPWAVLLIVLWPVSLAGTDDANPYTFIGFGLHPTPLGVPLMKVV